MYSSTKAKLDYPVPPPNGERAYTLINRDSKTSNYKENYKHVVKEVVIENLRGMEDSAILDTTGFQLFHRPAKHTSFATDEDIYWEYYPKSIELLKELTGASRAVLFNHSKHASPWTDSVSSAILQFYPPSHPLPSPRPTRGNTADPPTHLPSAR